MFCQPSILYPVSYWIVGNLEPVAGDVGHKTGDTMERNPDFPRAKVIHTIDNLEISLQCVFGLGRKLKYLLETPKA